MYNQSFGLRKNPFSLTPDPSFLFLTEQHREALVGLASAIVERKGFVVLTGEAGTGKTTLLARVLQFVPASRLQFSLIMNPTLTPSEFLELALLDFGLTDVPASKAQRLWKLKELLLQAQNEGRVSALIVDEAHKLTPEVLEEIRLLGNFEEAEQKFLQILLVGQKELDETLKRDDLRQMRQRISMRLSLTPLNSKQVGQYIRHRWLRAGGTEHPFAPEAVESISAASQGIPRVINGLCDHALIAAFADRSPRVLDRHVRDAVTGLNLGDSPQSEPVAAPRPVPIADSSTIEQPAADQKSSRWTRWAGRLGFTPRHEST